MYQGSPRADVLKVRFKRLEIADAHARPMDARQMEWHRGVDPFRHFDENSGWGRRACGVTLLHCNSAKHTIVYIRFLALFALFLGLYIYTYSSDLDVFHVTLD